MADTDIIQRIIIEAVDKASAVVNSLAQTVAGTATKIKSSLSQPLGAEQIAQSFARATQSISGLGTTASEALTAAAQAAQRFGASAQDLQKVESVINGLAARAKDGGKSFTELAVNYDRARGTIAGTAPALGAAGQAAERAGQSAQAATAGVSSLRREMSALLAVLSLMGGGALGSAVSAITAVGLQFGAAAAGVAALAVALTAATAASVRLGTIVEGLKKLADVSGSTVTAASRIQQALSRLGVAPDDFIKSMTSLQQRVASAMPAIRDEIAGAADKIAQAFDNVVKAQLNIERIPLKAEQLKQQGESLALQLQALEFRRQELALQGQQLVIGAQQIGLQRQQIASQLQYLPQIQSFQQRSIDLNLLDAQGRLRVLLLQKQLRDGSISQEEFAEKMAQEEDRALNRAIARARLDVEQAQLAKQQLADQQAQERQSLDIQRQMTELAAKQNQLEQSQQPLRAQELELQRRQLELQRQSLELDRKAQETEAREAQRQLREAQREADKAVANDIRDAIREMTAALKERREPKFGPDVTDETRLKAAFAAISEESLKAGGDVDALAHQLENLFKTDFGKSAAGLNLADQLGIPKIADAFRASKQSLDDILTTVQGLSDKQIEAAGKVTQAFNNMIGAADAAQQRLGAFNAEAAIGQLNALAATADATATSLKKIEDALGRQGKSALDLSMTPFGWLKNLLPGILDLLSVGKAGAAELPGGGGDDPFGSLKQQAAQAVDDIVNAFSGIGDKIRAAIGGGSTGEGVFDRLVAAAQDAASTIGEAFANVDISSALSAQIDALIAKFNELAAAASRAASAAGRAGGGGGTAGGGGGGGGGGDVGVGEQRFAASLAALGATMAGGDSIIAPGIVAAAAGGLFRGRSGVDTNLALLSDGEFIVRAAAVQRYGLQLLNALNTMTFPGFALGGLVPPAARMAPVPAFATGGLNRPGGRTFHLSFGGETFRNLVAPEEVAQKLERAAISRQTTSTGVKPRWSR